MKIIVMTFAMFSCLAATTYADTENLKLGCSERFREEEAKVLRQAPQGAKRTGRHHLRIKWTAGFREFADKAPYGDEFLEGTAYYYCGYNKTANIHLIHEQIDGLFTGILVDNASGKILPGGEKVSFSSDLSKYLAQVQPDGLDGEEWYVYQRNGQLVWKGLSGISEHHPKLNYDYFIVELSAPKWNGQGELEATGICASEREKAKKKETTVTLKRVGRSWKWLPELLCPKTSMP